MRTTKIVLLLGIFLGAFHTMEAQVKIGDNPLNIGANRMLEIENTNLGAGEFFIISDSLRLGRTTSTGTYDPFSDALMLKLYGYGLGNFTGSQSYFLGTNTNGEVLEFPLTLDLQSNSSTATLRMFDGTSYFGDVSLNPLDSIFATDTELRTLVAESANSDGDTITGNEWIELIEIGSDPNIRLTFHEDIYGPDSARNVSIIDLGPIVPRKFDVDTTIVNVRNELADTAQALRNQIFYKIDGTLDEDRTLTGLDHSLTFTDVDSFTVNGDNITVTGTGTTDITTEDDINLSSNSGDMNIDVDSFTVKSAKITVIGTGTTDITTTDDINLISNAGGVNINGATSGVNVTGTVNILNYGSGPVPGTETNVLGVTASGEIVEVSLDSIGGDATLSAPVDLDENGTIEETVDEAIQAANREIDSTIYNYNGELTGERTMDMAGNTLYFVGTGVGDTIMFGSNGTMAIGKSAPLTGTTNGIRLDVNGDILAMQVHSSSDKRFKKNIEKVTGALDKVKAMEGVTYDFRLDEFKNRNFPTTKQLGFIAQNVEAVVPEVVRTNADGYKAVDYSKITALLNEAIKEQQVQIEDQAALIKSQQILVASLLANQDAMAQELADVKASVKEVSNQTMSEE